MPDIIDMPTEQGEGAPPVHDLARKENFTTLFNQTYQRFEPVKEETRKNRLVRRANVDVKSLQASGQLAADETVVPIRVIDENVTRQLPKHLAFLKQSRRLAIFEPQDIKIRNNPALNLGPLESEFTRVMQYDGWELDYIRWLDGSAANGWDWVRVRHEAVYPGAVVVEHVRQDYLAFDTSVQDIQHSQMVYQAHPITLVTLYDYTARYGFDLNAAQKLEENVRAKAMAQNTTEASSVYYRNAIYVYEVFYKQKGIVYVGWWSKDINEFLKLPEPYYNGVDEPIPMSDPQSGPLGAGMKQTFEPTFEVEYPFVQLYDEVTEDATIVEHRGSAIKDYYMQDACTTLMSAFVCACQRAANYQIVPEKGTELGVAPKAQNFQIKSGAVWNQTMKFINTPWPDAMLPRALDILSTRNAIANDDIAWGVNNRQDSRKTAEEVKTANMQQSQVNSTQVLYFSIALRAVFTKAWRIIRSQALSGKIEFLATQPELLGYEYRLRSAGDIDYIARQERIQAMRIDWPVIQTTGAAMQFMFDYLKLVYPDTADSYIAAIQKAIQDQNQAGALIQKLAAALQAAVMTPNGQLKPDVSHDDVTTLQSLQQEVKQYLTNESQSTTGSLGGTPTAAPSGTNAGGAAQPAGAPNVNAGPAN